jgi:hypothetical protein
LITPVSPLTSSEKDHLVAMALSSVSAWTNTLGPRPRDIYGAALGFAVDQSDL